jgi:hypothetical protein
LVVTEVSFDGGGPDCELVQPLVMTSPTAIAALAVAVTARIS